jgi:hypothetical protein
MYDFPRILKKEYPELSEDKIASIIGSIHSQLHTIIHDLFAAYENEYSVFTPMGNCFEFFGLDFLIDDNFQVKFLEVNPGPDFKQTGNQLSLIIENFFEHLFRLLIDLPRITENKETKEQNFFISNFEEHKEFFDSWIPNLNLVYSKEWSVNQMKNSMTLM